MKTFRILGLALFAILLCLSACSGGNDDPIEPAPKPEVPKSEITIDSSIISNGLSFSDAGGEQSISFTSSVHDVKDRRNMLTKRYKLFFI